MRTIILKGVCTPTMKNYCHCTYEDGFTFLSAHKLSIVNQFDPLHFIHHFKSENL